jgi:hypothetical protein
LSEVDILVKMEDQTGGAAKSVEGNLKKMEVAANETGGAQGKLAGALKGMVGGANEVVQSLTGMNLAQFSAVGAIIAVTSAVKQAIGEYTSYVQTIDKMAMATGTSTEEMSRLVQVADDFRVETSSLETAMKLALQNGFTPTIENLATLADRYVSIKDPTARAAEMQKIFGRSWADLVPMLEKGGAAIREASAGVSESLIVTEAAKERAEEYRLAMDAWNDAIMGAKYALAEELIPAMTDFINAQIDGAAAVEEGFGKIEGLGGAYTNIAIAQKEAAIAAGEWGSSAREAGQAARYANDNVEDLTGSTNMSERAQNAYAARLKAAAAAVNEQAAAADKLRDIQDRLKTATDELAAAQQNWNESTGSDVVAQLEAAGVKGSRYEDALAAIDDTYGTGFGIQNDYKNDLQAMVAEYAKSGNIEEFKRKLSELEETYKPLDEAIAAALKHTQELNSELNSIPPRKDVWIYIHRVEIDEEGDGDEKDPNGDGKCCFVGETPVNTPDGLLAIKDLMPGDLVTVLTADGPVSAPILRVYISRRADLVTVHTSDGQALGCSPDHPFLTDAGFVPAGELQPGAALRALTPGVTVAIVTVRPGSFHVYDLLIGHAEHTFCAGGVVVHNKEADDTFGMTGYIAPTGNGYDNGAGASNNFNQTFGDVTLIIPGAGDPGETAERIRRTLGDLSDRARVSGAKYQGWNQ